MPSLLLSGAVNGAVLVTPPSSQSIVRVLGGELSSAGTIVTAQLLSNATVIWETKKLGATPFAVEINVDPERTIDTAPGEPLKLALSGGAVSGSIEYIVLGCDPRQLFVS